MLHFNGSPFSLIHLFRGIYNVVLPKVSEITTDVEIIKLF